MAHHLLLQKFRKISFNDGFTVTEMFLAKWWHFTLILTTVQGHLSQIFIAILFCICYFVFVFNRNTRSIIRTVQSTQSGPHDAKLYQKIFSTLIHGTKHFLLSLHRKIDDKYHTSLLLKFCCYTLYSKAFIPKIK